VRSINISRIFNGFSFRIFSNSLHTKICNIYGYSADIRLIYRSLKKLQFDTTNVCRTSGSEIIFLEHVEVEANLKYSRRGALQMRLTAPSGIVDLILIFQLFLFKIFSFLRVVVSKLNLCMCARGSKNRIFFLFLSFGLEKEIKL